MTGPLRAGSEPVTVAWPVTSAERVTSAEPTATAEPAASVEPVTSAEPVASAGPARRDWWRLVNRIIVVAFVVALAVGLVLFVRGQDWTPVRDLTARLDPLHVAVVLVGALLINATGLLLGVVSWYALFADLGAPVGRWTAARLFFVGFLAKFVPGRFIALPVLLRMGRDIEVGPVRLAGVFLLSWAVVALTGMTIALAAGPALLGGATGWLLLAVLPLVALFTRPELLNRLLAGLARLLRRPPPSVAASRVGIRRAITTQSLSWVVSGHHLWLLAVTAGAPPVQSYLVCVAGFAAATVAGLLVVVAPDGLGVREAVLLVGLATVLPASIATPVVLASRLVCALSEVLVGAGGLAVAQYLHRRQPGRQQPAGPVSNH